MLRLSKRYVVALNFLLVGVAAYFAALAVNDVIAMRLAPATAPPRAESGPVSRVPSVHTRAYYQEIVKRDIFNLSPELSAPVAAPVAEDLHLQLTGVSHLTKGEPYVIIQDRQGQQSLYRVGDTIPDAGKLVSVLKDSAIIEHNGKRVALKLPKNELPGPVTMPPKFGPRFKRFHMPNLGPRRRPNFRGRFRPKPFDADVTDLGSNRYAVPRATVNHSLQNLSELFTQIRAVPDVVNGRTLGFTVSEIEPGSLFDEMGLEDDDVITTVNGQTLNDPVKAMQMLSGVRDQRSISVSVLREGKPLQLSYDIR
jgi:type II secretion system protein C